MYNFLVQNQYLAIAFILLVVVIVIILAVKAMQAIGLSKVRAFVYKKFVEAEHQFEYGDNQAKFDYVIQLARSQIPLPFSLFITESNLRKVIQLWFDICKDLLDDGKVNGTGMQQ